MGDGALRLGAFGQPAGRISAWRDLSSRGAIHFHYSLGCFAPLSWSAEIISPFVNRKWSVRIHWRPPTPPRFLGVLLRLCVRPCRLGRYALGAKPLRVPNMALIFAARSLRQPFQRSMALNDGNRRWVKCTARITCVLNRRVNSINFGDDCVNNIAAITTDPTNAFETQSLRKVSSLRTKLERLSGSSIVQHDATPKSTLHYLEREIQA